MQTTVTIILIALYASILSCSTSSKTGEDGLGWKARLKIADELLIKKYYYDATVYYEKVLEAKPEHIHAQYMVAEAYFYSRDYQTAKRYYQQVAENKSAPYPYARYYYAQCLKMTGDYEAAKKEFTTFIDKYNGEDKITIRQKVKNDILGCDFALQPNQNAENIKIEHLKGGVNAAYTESSPLPVGKDVLYFSSLKSDSAITTDGKKDPKAFFRLYMAAKKRGSFSDVIELPDVINVHGEHVANGTFSPDSQFFYFTRCKENESGDLLCDLYRSNYVGGEFKKPQRMAEPINMAGFTTTHPAVSEYRQGQQILYFVSDRPGGKGGLDIWYSVIATGGNVKKPVNAGNIINTSGNEITPFCDNQTNMLYFSSDRHPGLGGYDIFKTEGSVKRWSPPENMGYPINSSVDDIYYVNDRFTRGGYFVSNRIGTIALKNETCCDDIFSFRWTSDYPPKIAVIGYAYNEDDPQQSPLDIYKAKLHLATNDSSDILMHEVSVDTTYFFFNLTHNRQYKIVATKQGYFPNTEELSTMGIKISDTLFVKIPLKKLEMNASIILKDIYYDFDKATLRSASHRTLDQLTEILNENANIIIELSSHTDSRGSDEYNIKLSQRRAESVVKYLIKSGIPKKQLTAKGYGESKPIALNENPDGSDNHEGRQMNRRTEIKVIGRLDIVKKQADLKDALEDAK